MPDERTVVERVHTNARWGVASVLLPGQSSPQRILKFSNEAETDIDTYPLSDEQALAIAKALTRPVVPTAAPEDVRRFG